MSAPQAAPPLLEEGRALAPARAAVERSLVIEVPTPTFLAAVDLEIRLQTIVSAQVMSAEEPTIVVRCPQRRLGAALKVLSEWSEGNTAHDLEIRVDQRRYTLRPNLRAGLRWTDVEGTDLADVDVDGN